MPSSSVTLSTWLPRAIAGGVFIALVLVALNRGTWAKEPPPTAKTLATDSKADEKPAGSASSATTDAEIIAFINEQIRKGWTDNNVTGTAVATDAEWCRRVYLDIIGRIPTIEELNAFTGAKLANKKSELVELLLSERHVEEYVRNWTTIWTNVLIGRNGGLTDNTLIHRGGMQQYLRRSLQTNKPYDALVYEMVTATGAAKPDENGFNGAVNFLINDLEEKAANATAKTARVFLGLQVQCTQCHNHPFNDWKQNQFWEFNAFFRQAKALRKFAGNDVRSARLENEDFAGEGGKPEDGEIYYELRNGLMKVAYPVFVDGTKVDSRGWVSEVNRRQELGKLIRKSPYLGQAIANRMWGHFLGYGFTKPIDDMGPHNPPTHPELLDRLGQEFAAHGHDLKKLIRWVTLSEAYSLSSRFGKKSIDDPSKGEKPLFSHFYLRQMRAEELYESLLVATEAHKTQGGYEEQEKTKGEWLKQFTIAFGTDENDETTTFNGTIPQALMLMNGDLIKKATSVEPGGFLHKVAASPTAPSAKVNYLYLAAYGRKPSANEVGVANAAWTFHKNDATAALQDVWWALLNSNEFILNH